MKPTCSIVIPAYNAEKTIASVFSRISKDTWDLITSVYIINDGSIDKTANIIEQLQYEFPNIKLVSFKSNHGYGSAVAKGLELSIKSDANYTVCLHADGQYPPEKISEFVHYMHENKIDILQGSRHKEGTALVGGMPLYKYIAGKCLVWIENQTFDLNLTDYHSGFIFYSKRALKMIPFNELSDSFDFDLEMIAVANKRNLNISELAIPTFYGYEKSYLNPIIYGLRILKILYKYKSGYYD